MYNSSCVLVCISGKKDCNDLIEAGNALAKRDGLKLSLLVVLPQKACFSPDHETLNMLYDKAKEYDAELNVFFDDNPAQCASDFAMQSHAFSIVTGFPSINSSHFVSRIHALLPHIPINMVKENKVFHISDAMQAENEISLKKLLQLNI